jgi:lipopolysaccharide heptosyltransferase I
MPAAKRVPLSEYPARRIALIKPSALGDIVHSLPVLTAIRGRYPDAYITWVVNRGYEPLLKGHPDLNATLPFDRMASRSGWLESIRNYSRFLREFRRQGFDLVIDLQGLLRSGLMVAASASARRVGLSSAREGAAWFYTDTVPVADFNAIHAVDRYWLVAQSLGAGNGPKRFRVPIPEAERQWVSDSLHGYARPWLVLGVGSRWVTKRWLPDHFAVLARMAQDRFGATIMFVGGLDERALSQRVVAQLKGAVCDLSGQTTLPRLAAVLEQADLMLGNDTGPLHLAAALGLPVLAPYTCTRVLLNGPYGAQAHGVESRIWCQGSYLKRCSRMECMSELTPDRLSPILLEMLQAWERRRRSA